MKRTTMIGMFLVFSFIFLGLNLIGPSIVKALSPCCLITGIDHTTGIVTAKVIATGKMIQFKPNGFSPVDGLKLMNSLRIGQPISADMATGKVSVGSSSPCCSIIQPNMPMPVIPLNK